MELMPPIIINVDTLGAKIVACRIVYLYGQVQMCLCAVAYSMEFTEMTLTHEHT